jgi:hypothetical protein
MIASSASGKPDLVIWTGPVWAGNLAKVQWSNATEVLALSCVGSDACAALATSLPAVGRLDALLRAHGRSVDAYDKIMLGSFSAGHGFANLLLGDPTSAQRIACFGAFDSYYTGAAPGLKQGYAAYAKLAASGDGHLMWTSCSTIADRKWLSCEASIAPLLDAIEPSEASLPGDLDTRLKAPLYFVQRAGFVHANYGTIYKHAEHATVVAPAVFELWLSSIAHGEPPASWVKGGALALGAAALGWGGWKLGKRLFGG